MKNIIKYPFKKALEEIKKDKHLQKQLDKSISKVNVIPFIFASYLFLLIISIMYISFPYNGTVFSS